MEPNWWQALILGIVQGLAEFLPISSTGHLVIGERLLGIKPPGTTFEVAVHLGTLLSVIIFFHKRLLKLTQSLWNSELKAERRMIFMLFLGTLPAVFAGLVLKPHFESLKQNLPLVCGLLVVTAILLMFQRFGPKGEKEEVGPFSAVVMGCFQAFAILPGISRSGSTIVGGLITKVKAAQAAEFSFLLSIPAILGAVVLDAEEFLAMDPSHIQAYVVGATAAFVSGLIAVYLVLEVIKRGKLEYFAYYCATVGIAGVLYFSLA